MRNPGSRYERTRHNVGAEVVAALAERHDARFKKAPRFVRAEVSELHLAGARVVLAVPRTFMNESGQAVAPLVRYYRTPADELLVVHDDIDLPFAKLRVQEDRGPGGNNGVRSIIRSLGSQEFWRLKIGVGRPPGRQNPADYVLRPFSTQERPEIDLSIQLAADVIETFVAEGGDAARQRAGELNA
ncbi:MAG TPA: aminoacyl-tRNA hydrolase [Acidimicrobiia bacterium]|nr:aminoacyl-tRNA hydrolase [Acidimicrobiia bacterium]